MDAEMVKFTFDTIMLGVGSAMGQAVHDGELTEVEAQAGIDKVIENLSEMLAPVWQDALRHHINQMHGDIPHQEGADA